MVHGFLIAVASLVVVHGFLIAVASLVVVHGFLIAVASLVVVHGFQGHLAAVAQGLISSAACGIFLDQGSNPRLLHCQADS